MSAADLYFVERLIQIRVDEALRQAERSRLLRRAGIQTQGWLLRQACWLLWQFGRLLVAVGQQLQQRDELQPGSFEERAMTRNLFGGCVEMRYNSYASERPDRREMNRHEGHNRATGELPG